jgi:hypothetical protein
MYDRSVQYKQKVDVISTAGETIGLEKWYAPTSQPTYKRALHPSYSTTFYTVDPYALTVQPPISIGTWAYLPMLPTRRTDQRNAYPSTVVDPYILTQKEDIKVNKWFAPPSQPTYRKMLPASQQTVFSISPYALTQAESVSADKWFYQPQIPVRTKYYRDAPQTFVSVVVTTETITPDKWFAEASRPTLRKELKSALHQPFTTDSYGQTQPEVTSLDKWFAEASRPTYRKGLPAQAHQFFTIDTKAITLAEGVSIDKWGQPPSQPTYRRGLRATDNPHLSIDSSLLTTPEAVSPDKWFYGPQTPQRKMPKDSPQSFVAVVAAGETVTIDKWFAEASRPGYRKTQPTIYPVVDPSILTTPEVTAVEKWLGNQAIPPKRIIAVNDAGSLFLFTPAAAPETITPDKWYAAASEPMLRKVPNVGPYIAEVYPDLLPPTAVTPVGRRRKTKRVRYIEEKPEPLVVEENIGQKVELLQAEANIARQAGNLERLGVLLTEITRLETILSLQQDDEDITILLLS